MEETSTISYYPLHFRVKDTESQEELQIPELVGRPGMRSSHTAIGTTARKHWGGKEGGPKNTNIGKTKKNEHGLWGGVTCTLVKCPKFCILPNVSMAFHMHCYCKLWSYLCSSGIVSGTQCASKIKWRVTISEKKLGRCKVWAPLEVKTNLLSL